MTFTLSGRCVVVTGLILFALCFVAGTARADETYGCVEKNHDSSQVQVIARMNHPATYPWHEAKVRSGPDWTNCAGNEFAATNVVDVYAATYADKLVNGSWVTGCSKKVAGWRGANVGAREWWTVIVQNNTWWRVDYCDWNHKKVRTRGLGKAEFRDGHIVSTWTYTQGHASIW